MTSMTSLEEFVHELEQGSFFERVELIPPTGVPEGSDERAGRDRLLFGVRAVREGA